MTWASWPQEVLIKSEIIPSRKSRGLSEQGAAAPGARQPLGACRGRLLRALSSVWAAAGPWGGGKGLKRPPAQFPPALIPAGSWASVGAHGACAVVPGGPQPRVHQRLSTRGQTPLPRARSTPPSWGSPRQPGAAAGPSWGWRFPGSLAPGFLLFFRAAALPATGRSQRRAAGGPPAGTSASRGRLARVLCARGTAAGGGLRWGLARSRRRRVRWRRCSGAKRKAGDGPAVVSCGPSRRAGRYFQLRPGFHFPVPVAVCQRLGSRAGSRQCRAVSGGGSEQGEPFPWAGFTRFWLGGRFCGAPGAREGRGPWRVRAVGRRGAARNPCFSPREVEGGRALAPRGGRCGRGRGERRGCRRCDRAGRRSHRRAGASRTGEWERLALDTPYPQVGALPGSPR